MNNIDKLRAANTRITELETQLKVAQETIATLRDYNDRAPRLAVEVEDRRIAELEARLKEAENLNLRLRGIIVEHEKDHIRIMDEYDRAEAGFTAERDAAMQRASIAEARLKEAVESAANMEALFNITLNGIREEAQGALGYEQMCDAQTAVHRLTARLKEAEETYQRLMNNINQLEARAEKAEARLKEAEREREYERSWKEANATQAEMLAQTVEKLGAAKSKAEADAERRLAALEAVEWHDNSGRGRSTKSAWLQCPWCLKYKGDGHKPDCARQAALSPAEAGEVSADVVAQIETNIVRLVEAAKEAYNLFVAAGMPGDKWIEEKLGAALYPFIAVKTGESE